MNVVERMMENPVIFRIINDERAIFGDTDQISLESIVSS